MNRRDTLRLSIAALALPTMDAIVHARTPEWILPVDSARALAKRERKPLLIVSLNGNLDGNC